MRFSSVRLLVVVSVALLGSLAVSAADAPAPVLLEHAGSYGRSATCQIALGDLDADGDLDAVFSNMHANTEIWTNNGDGGFTRSYQRIGGESHGVAIGDLDGDGDEDLILTYASTSTPTRVYWNDGTGRFAPAGEGLGDDALNANAIWVFDAEGDGDLDVAVYYNTGVRHNRIYLNQGDGSFEHTDSQIPGLPAWGDIDSDGDIDAVALLHQTNGSQGIKIFRNDGANTFEEAQHIAAAVPFLPGAIALGDIDGDGDLDLVGGGGSTLTAPVTVLQNDSDGSFEPVPDTGFGCAGRLVLADFNGDEWADVYLATLGTPQQIGLSDGVGGLVDAGIALGIHPMLGTGAAGDLDGDGDVDLFIAIYGHGGPNEVWLNVSERLE